MHKSFGSCTIDAVFSMKINFLGTVDFILAAYTALSVPELSQKLINAVKALPRQNNDPSRKCVVFVLVLKKPR